jgi:hypothetical protein
MTKPKINISINPWYFCNFKCDFCYLTPEQLGDRKRLDLETLEQRLDELLQHYVIGHIDLYGGEVLLLPEEYINAIRDMLHVRGIDDLVLVTNLSHLHPVVHEKDWEISVSYDFDAREKHEHVLQNMLLMTQPFSILSLAGRQFLDKVTPDIYVDTMNMFGNLKGCEIKPYSSNQANDQPVTYREYEEFVWAVIDHPARNFYFENATQVEEAFEGTRNSFSDDHIYITPEGKFAVLEFDDNDHEFFMPLESIAEYQQWCVIEKSRVNVNPICSACPYNGSCLSEHLRNVTSLDNSCNGFRGLIDKWGAS